MERYRNKYRGASHRLREWDYGSPGFYYVTICTKDREHYFGDVVTIDDTMMIKGFRYGTAPWDGTRGGIVGTHDYASLPPAAHPAHVPAQQSLHSNVIVKLTTIGEIASRNWMDIPKHFPFVSLDEFIVMPNHVHGILCFRKPGYRKRNVNSFGPQSENLGSVIRGFKAATKTEATIRQINFHWQAKYHDRVITSGNALERIRAYIKENPAKWIQKRLNNTI